MKDEYQRILDAIPKHTRTLVQAYHHHHDVDDQATIIIHTHPIHFRDTLESHEHWLDNFHTMHFGPAGHDDSDFPDHP